jgi:hypothetical protein
VAFSLVALLGMLVLVVDLGGMLTLRRRMVQASDAGALAAAQSCAAGNSAEAAGKADQFALANADGASRTLLDLSGCTGESSGTVRVGYQSSIDLHFAPVLGFGSTTVVGARSVAIWGPAGGDSPVPIEFPLDPASGVFPCVRQPVGTPCNYWFDQTEDHDLQNNSNWGFMNLNAWGVSADASCPNSGSSDRRGWITGDLVSKVVLRAIPTYVCVDSGHATSSWFDALISQVGKIKHFPINDPRQMVMVGGKEKYAIVGFAALKLERVLSGSDPEATGVPGQDDHCRDEHDFTTSGTLAIDDLNGTGCPDGDVPDSISNLDLRSGQGRNEIVYQAGVHYQYDAGDHEIQWLTVPTPDVRVEFDWATQGVAGLCGIHDRDPNAVCLVTSYQGVKIGGTNPGAGEDFGLRAIRLSE